MPDYLSLGQAALKGQPFSVYLGTELVAFEPGRAVLALAIRPEFSQQHGYAHGGVVSYLIDNALSFAGGSVLGENVITVEYKVNYMRPPVGNGWWRRPWWKAPAIVWRCADARWWRSRRARKPAAPSVRDHRGAELN